MYRRVMAVSSAVAFLVSAASALDLSPVVVPATISGVAVRIPVKAAVDLKTVGQAVEVRFVADADMSDLQAKLLEIVRASPLPSDNCARVDNVNLVVNSVDRATLVASGARAVATVSGKVTLWGCARIFGSRAKTKLLSDDVSISAPLELYLPDARSIAGKIAGPIEVKASDSRVQSLLRLLVSDYEARVADALRKLLESKNAVLAIPALQGVDASFSSASFRGEGQALHVEVKGAGSASATALDVILGGIEQAR